MEQEQNNNQELESVQNTESVSESVQNTESVQSTESVAPTESVPEPVQNTEPVVEPTQNVESISKPRNNQNKTVGLIITIIIILGIGYFIFTILRSYYDNLRIKNEKEIEAKEVVKETDIELNSAAVVESMARIKIFNKCSGYLPTIFYKQEEVKISDLTVDEIVTMLYFSKYEACGEVLTISPDDVKDNLMAMFGRDDFTILEANQNFSITTDANQNYIITPKNCGMCDGDMMESTISKATIANNSMFVYENYNSFKYKWTLNKGSDGRYYFVSISKI